MKLATTLSTMLFIAVVFTNNVRSQMNEFNGKQISRINSIELNGPIDEVFHLFTPIGEKKWAEGWEPKIIYPQSQDTQTGMVFSTRHIDEHLTYWVIVDYNSEEHFIQYVNFIYDFRSVVLKIKCNRIDENKTEAVINYCYTGLSEKGNKFIDTVTKDKQKEYIESWQADINNHLVNNN